MSRRLFVGGLSRDTNETSLKDYFTKFGELEECLIIYDRDSGLSKSFGFVTFTESSMAEQALAQEHHALLGRKVDVKLATPRARKIENQEHVMSNLEQNLEAVNIQSRVKKIFVGGLPENLSTTEFKTYFESFGPVEDVVVMHNIEGKPRGFGFVTFHSEDVVNNVLQQKFHDLKNKRVEVKKAEPKKKMISSPMNSDHNPILDSYNCYESDTGLACQGSYWDPYWDHSPILNSYNCYESDTRLACQGSYWDPYWGSNGPYGYCYYYPPQSSFNPYYYATTLPSCSNGQILPSQASSRSMLLTAPNNNQIPTSVECGSSNWHEADDENGFACICQPKKND